VQLGGVDNGHHAFGSVDDQSKLRSQQHECAGPGLAEFVCHPEYIGAGGLVQDAEEELFVDETIAMIAVRADREEWLAAAA
jgi:hypothetical protein